MVAKTWSAIIQHLRLDEVEATFHSQAESNPDSAIAINSMYQKRPFGVTLLLWMVLCLSAWGLLRFFAALNWRDILSQYHASLSPLYLSITGAVWAVAGAVLLWSIWAGKRWSHRAIPVTIALWLLQYWIERIFFQSPRANLPFMIALSMLLLLVTLVCTFNRKTKNFLLRSEENE
jgi:hypothetical protein